MWGDSHTGNINLGGLDLFFNVIKISTPGCPPLFQTFRNEPNGNGNNCNCATMEDRLILKKYISNLQYDVVALTSRWSMYLDGYKIEGKLQMPHHHFIVDSSMLELNFSQRKKLFSQSLLNTIDYFKNSGKRIIMIKQTPDLCHYKSAKKIFWEGTYGIPLNQSNSTKFIDLVFRKIQDKTVYFADLNDGLISKDSKIIVYKPENNCLMFKDDNHLSEEAGKIVGSNLINFFIKFKVFGNELL